MKRGLIVDDADVARINLKTILREKYDIVAEATNGLEAVELYQKYRPDFVTMDITMAEQNGMDALRSIKALDPNAQVIMVSAVATKPNVYAALTIGAKNFVIKPYEKEKVLEAVERLFK